MDQVNLGFNLYTDKADAAMIATAKKGRDLFEKRGFNLNLKGGDLPLGRITGDFDKFSGSLDAATARVLAFTATTTVVYGLSTAFSRLFTDSIKLEKQLAGIQAILQTSNSNLQKFSSELFNVANATGQSFDVAAQAASEFARQGLSLEDTLKATNAALAFSKIAGTDAAQTVENLTAAINTFTNEALSYTDVIDTIVSLDNAFAISAAGISDGLKRVGSVASESGIQLKEIASLISVVQQVSARGAPVISNGLKTIFTRLGRTSVQETLNSIGIATQNSNGEFRSQIDVLTDLSNKLDTLSDSQRAFVLEQVAGVYQINTLQATLKSLNGEYSLFDKAVKVASDSSGNAAERLKILTNTTDANLQKLKNNLTQFLAETGKVTVKPILDSFVGIGNKILGTLNLGAASEEGEKAGNSIGTFLLNGISSVLSGPGTVLLIVGITKLLSKVTKDAFIAVQTLAGLKKTSLVDEKVQSSINKAIETGNQALVRRLATTTSIVEKASILQTLMADMARNQGIAQVNEAVSAGLSANKKATASKTRGKADGFIPTYARGFIPKGIERMEKRGAMAGGYSPKKVVAAPASIGGVMNEAESTVLAEGMKQPFINPPKNSKAGRKHRKKALEQTGIDPYSLMSAGGFIPNFAYQVDKQNLGKNQVITINGLVNGRQSSLVADNNNKAKDKVENLKYKVRQIQNPYNNNFKDSVSEYQSSGYKDSDWQVIESQLKGSNYTPDQIKTFKENLDSKGTTGKSLITGKNVRLDRQITGIQSKLKGAYFENVVGNLLGKAISRKKVKVPESQNSRMDLLNSKGYSLGEIKSGGFSYDNLVSKAIASLSQEKNEKYRDGFYDNIKFQKPYSLFVPTPTSSRGFIPNFASRYTEARKQKRDELRASLLNIGDFAGGAIKNVNAQTEFNQARDKNPNVEFDDKINQVGFKVERIPILDKEFEASLRSKTENKKVTTKFENYAIDYLNTKGYSFKEGRNTLYGKENASVDGYNIRGNFVELLEVKGGGWDSPDVSNKFGRFAPENLVDLAPELVPKFFKEGDPDPNIYDKIRIRNTLAIPALTGGVFKKNINAQYPSADLKAMEKQRQKKTGRKIPAKFAWMEGLINQGLVTNSSGFIPNFASRLSYKETQKAQKEAIDREVASGQKRSDVRVGSDNSLITSFNPEGLGIYNKDEKTLKNGINLAKEKGIDPRSKGMFSSYGFIPNFAEDKDRKKLDKIIDLQQDWKDYIEGEKRFGIMSSPSKSTTPITENNSNTLSWTPMKSGISSNLDNEFGQGSSTFSAQLPSEQNTFQSSPPKRSSSERARVQEKWDQSKASKTGFRAMASPAKRTSSIASADSSSLSWTPMQRGMSSNLDPEFEQSVTASNALEERYDRRGTAEMPPSAKPGAARRPTSMLKPGFQPGSSMETNEPDQAAKDEAKANKLSRFSTRMMGAGMAVPMLTGMLSTPEAGKEQTSGQKTLESIGESVGAGVAAATTAAMIPGLAPLAPAIGVAVGGFKLLTSAAKNSVPSIKNITDSNDKLVAANEAQIASLNETVQKQEEISQLKSSGADPRKIAKAQLELAKSMKGIGDAELVNTLTNEKDQGKKQSAIADFQERKTKETNFSQGLAGTAALVQKSQMDNTKWYNGIYKSNDPKDRPELKSEDMGTFLNPIIDAMDLTKPASKEAAKGIEKLKNGTLSMGDFISKFGKEMGLSESQVSDASKSFENLSSNFNPKSISSLNEYAGQLLNVNNLIASTSATAEAPVLNIDFQKVFDKGLQDLTLDTALTNYKGYAEQTSNLDIEKNQFALDQQSGKFSKTAIIRKQSEMQGREQNMAFDKQGAGIVDKAVADLTSMLPKNLNTDQMSAILDESKNVLANGGDLTKLEDLIRASVGTTGESNDILQNIAKINEETTQAVEMLKTDRAAATKTRTAIEEANVQNAISANAADMGTSILKGDTVPSKNKLLDPEALAKNESKIMDLRYKADAARESGNTKGEKAARDEIKALELENARMRSEDLAAQEEQFGAVNVVGQEAEQAGRESLGKQAINERIVGEQGNILKKLKFSDESIKSISEGLKLGGEYALDAKSQIEKGLEGTDVANASPETKALIERLKTIGGEQNVFKRAGPLETANQGKPAWETSTAKLAEETLTGRIGSDEVLRRGKSDVMDKSIKEAQKAQEESKKAELEYQTYEAETAEMAKKGPIDPVEKRMRKEEAARLKQKSEEKKRDSQIASNKAKTAKESFEAFAADPTQSLSFLNDAKGKEAGLQKLEKSEDPNLKAIAEKARNLDKKKKELEDIRSQTTPKSTETKAREKQLEQEVATGSKELTSLGKRNSSAIKNTLYKDQVAPGISGLVQKPQDKAKVDAYNAKVVERQGLEGNLSAASKEVSDIEAKRIEREKVSKAFKATEGGPLTTEQRFTLAGRFNRGEITAEEADKQSGGLLRKAYKSVNKTDEGFEDLNKTGNIKTKIGNRDQLQQSVDKAKSEESQLGKAMQPVLDALTGVANAQAAAVEADAARAQAEQDKKDGKGTEEAPAADGGEKKISSTSTVNVTVTGGSLSDPQVAQLEQSLRKYSVDTINAAFQSAGLQAPNLGPPETTAVA